MPEFKDQLSGPCFTPERRGRRKNPEKSDFTGAGARSPAALTCNIGDRGFFAGVGFVLNNRALEGDRLIGVVIAEAQRDDQDE